MKSLVSIRMRASKKCGRGEKSEEIHISGAEGLYEPPDIQRVARAYIERAVKHPRGSADRIVLTIEDIPNRPRRISSLPVITVPSGTPQEGRRLVINILRSVGISEAAIGAALATLRKGGMRGASLIDADSGMRREHDVKRGIRASRFGITKSSAKRLEAALSRCGINTETVKEAVILASKVGSCKDVVAELCVSDDPDYTTGYVASKKYGYIRIPNIKRTGSRTGGRAFFVAKVSDATEVTAFLEKTPVIIDRISPCGGVKSLDEIIDSAHQ
ncbi:MAG TPA: 6-carboxyhexanoate--CoA ligase [Thermodesulfovibrionales bacterium]|nr:6-carboxyhexanoate--CoA ligase [Thermodesulfovibrionales bacterium]